MVNVAFALITTGIGIISLLFAVWWTCWILFENEETIPPQHRRPLQILIVFGILASSYFLTFGIVQEDLGNAFVSDEHAVLTLSSYGVISLFLFVALLFWDMVCRGRNSDGLAPHLIPAFPACVALLAMSCSLVPGTTLLSLYMKYREESPDFHREYIDKLLPKGIGLVSVGAAVDAIALVIYLLALRYRKQNPPAAFEQPSAPIEDDPNVPPDYYHQGDVGASMIVQPSAPSDYLAEGF